MRKLYKNTSILLRKHHGVDESGKSALYLAAAEQFPDIVKLLLQRGANPNSQTKDGRSPLMEAALWGRYENVKPLLDFGADKNWEDGEGFTAMQLAEPSTRNEGERYRRSGRGVQMYKEITYVANQARRMIVHLLSNATEDAISVPRSNYDYHVFHQKETVI
ncbi:uncharacterized protein A1O5_06683 [Cladophialophora psammophila CBS 110553]|uniref:Uncharacterized protein n=1 Tax=Cladophialophora psammophila CBS 110553 TaxID=1182543 RepID=W9WQX5_9EURO|nr:uncharacterized protein A1O5_06683 [Cladophialophora psammophila CBS 110553]EXJ70612.1 hypothetical protein A1O5_06683 [Cladophialophora psammophila CBS 110553]